MSPETKQLLLDLRALLADLQQWSKDANKIADMDAAIQRIDKAIETNK